MLKQDISLLPVVELLVASCKRFPGQARKLFRQAALDELRASIEATGLVNAIVVQEDPAEPGTYFVVAGERRWLSFQALGRVEIAAKVAPPEADAFTIGMVDNLGREDLNAIEEASGYHLLMTTRGYSQTEVARLVGKHQTHISSTLSLLKLPEDLQQEIVEERLTAAHGLLLARSCKSAKEMREVLHQVQKRQHGITRVSLESLRRYLLQRRRISRLVARGTSAEQIVARELKDDLVPTGRRFLGLLRGLVAEDGGVDTFAAVWPLVPPRDRTELLKVLQAIAGSTQVLIRRLQVKKEKRG